MEIVPRISMICSPTTMMYTQDLGDKREKKGGQSFAVSFSKLWNKLHCELRKKEFLFSFKNALRKRF